MTNQTIKSAWSQDRWHDRARAWIQTSLAEQGIIFSDDIEQIHEYPWSTIFKITSDKGNLFFKATATVTAYEIVASVFIKSLNARAMPDILASHFQEGWMIMRDGGQRLREQLQIELDWQHWHNLLPQYAGLQIQLSTQPDRLLDCGIPDRRLDKFPSLFLNIIENRVLFQPDSDDALSDEDYQRLLDLAPVVEAKASQLASYTIPETIHHGDLHDGNIFWDGSKYVFFDWGDICLSHPFFSLRTAYVSAEMRFDLEEYSPELHRLRDAYLPAWREFESEGNLLVAFDLAMELWAISSLLSWHQGISRMDAEYYKNYQHVLPSLAEELLSLIKP